MSIKPIETVYNNYRFRSRLEARWAVLFDQLDITYQYEVEGFDLGGDWYLPDFYLPDWNSWVEVKPVLPTLETVIKVLKLRHGMIESRKQYDDGHIVKDHCYIFCGSPGVPNVRITKDGWKLKDGSIILNPIALEPSSIEIPNSKLRLAKVATLGKGSAELLCTVNAFAMVGGGTTLDIWNLYVGRIDQRKIPDFPLSDLDGPVFLVPNFPSGFTIAKYVGPGVLYDTPNLQDAYAAARQARFEHGKMPRTR